MREFRARHRAARGGRGLGARRGEGRRGFAEFVREARAAGWDVHVVSSGFHELIEPVLEREGVDVLLHANRVDASPTGWRVDWRYPDDCDHCGESCKRALLPNGYVVYVGDGYSDRARRSPPTACSRLRSGALPRRARYPLRAVLGLPRPLRCVRQRNRYGLAPTACRCSASLSPTIGAIDCPLPAFGPDLANLWHDDGLHRVVDGREVRIADAPGGVDVEPLRREDRAGRPQAPRSRVRPRRVLRVRRGRASARGARRRAARPAAADRGRAVREPSHLDHGPAGLVASSVRDQEPAGRALRHPRRACVRVPRPASGSRSPARRALGARLLASQGRLRRRTGAERPRSRGLASCPTRRSRRP